MFLGGVITNNAYLQSLKSEPGRINMVTSDGCLNFTLVEIKHTPSSAVSDEEEDEQRRRRKLTVPTVFRWEYGGKEVYLSGSFNEWKTRIPMAYRYFHICLKRGLCNQ